MMACRTRLGWIAPLMVFLVACAITWWNAAPSTTFHDSGEFALAAASAGVPHAPGSPTYAMLASAFVRLGPFSEPARGTNFFSGLMGALTLMLVFLLTRRWIVISFPTMRRCHVELAALTAPLVLFGSSAFLEQSFVTEQYTLLTALLAWLFVHGTILFESTRTLQIEPNSLPRRICGHATLLGFIAGLAVGNHPSQLCLAVPIAAILISSSRRGRRLQDFGQLAMWTCLGAAAALSVFLWIPIRSAANPVMDSGNGRTLHSFMRMLFREEFGKRPLSEAPPHFIGEWITSYDFLGQLGIAGCILLVVGFYVLARRGSVVLLWLALFVVPYAGGMLYAHLTQQGMNVNYIRQYGVTDWHIPIYTATAVIGGLGAAWLLESVSRGKPSPTAPGSITSAWKETLLPNMAGSALLAVILVFDAYVLRSASLRGFQDASQFVHDLMAPLPDGAMVLAVSDDVGGMLAYEAYGKRPPEKKLRVFFDKIQIGRCVSTSDGAGGWNAQRKMENVLQVDKDLENQPYRVPPVTPEEARSCRLFADVAGFSAENAKYMRPAGFLFEIMDRPVSDTEVLAAELEWRDKYPEALSRHPTQATSRLVCEARGIAEQFRGGYFTQRSLWALAGESYSRSLEWLPSDGEAWFCLGFARDKLHSSPELVKACYEEAIHYAPWLVGPRANLAELYLKEGNKARARELLQEELRLDPKNHAARANLELLNRQAK